MAGAETLQIDIATNLFDCPVTFERFSPENFPVALPCGHTLSREAVEEVLSSNRRCSICREFLPLTFKPEKNLLLSDVMQSVAQAEISKEARSQRSCCVHVDQSAAFVCEHDDGPHMYCYQCALEQENEHYKSGKLLKVAEYKRLLPAKLSALKAKLHLKHQLKEQTTRDLIRKELRARTQLILAEMEPLVLGVVKFDLQTSLESRIFGLEKLINNSLLEPQVDHKTLEILSCVKDLTLPVSLPEYKPQDAAMLVDAVRELRRKLTLERWEGFGLLEEADRADKLRVKSAINEATFRSVNLCGCTREELLAVTQCQTLDVCLQELYEEGQIKRVTSRDIVYFYSLDDNEYLV